MKISENRLWDLQSFIREIFHFQFVFGRLKTLRDEFGWFLLILETFWIFTIPLYNLKEAQQLFFISKITFSVLENPHSPIFRLDGISRADWELNTKVGDQNWKTEGGVLGYGTSIFEKEKNQGVRCKKRLKISWW